MLWSTVGRAEARGAEARASWLTLTMSFLRKQINRVAVIGAGPAGAAALDALVREQAFDVVRVFEPVSYTHLTLPTNREV